MRIRVLSLLLCGILLTSMTARTTAPASAASMTTANAVVATYFTMVNNILKGASTNQLSMVFAPTGMLSVSTPDGKTSVFKGIAAINGWYKAFAASHAGIQLKQVSQRTPLLGMVVHYEIAVDATNAVKGRCAHIFAVTNGKIVSDDFIVFAGG